MMDLGATQKLSVCHAANRSVAAVRRINLKSRKLFYSGIRVNPNKETIFSTDTITTHVSSCELANMTTYAMSR